MANLFVVFVTGLTTGGLSCLAVQGGLLASSVAHQAEQAIRQELEMPDTAVSSQQQKQTHLREQRQQVRLQTELRKNTTRPILLFLGAKLIAYTALGFLLGWLGGIFQFTPWTRAILQLVVGLFMVGTALRMLNVHPLFRYFALEPPSFVRRTIRQAAKKNDGFAPVFLGVLTILIPCGVTQAMMAVAIGSGDPLEGAAILFAFTLGTSPLFFTLAYLVTQVGKKLEARFTQVTAVVVLILGAVAINASLNLMGSPLSLSRLTAVFAPTQTEKTEVQPLPTPTTLPSEPALHFNVSVATPSPTPPSPNSWVLTLPTSAPAPASSTESQPTYAPSEWVLVSSSIEIEVQDFGYSPNLLTAPAGQSIQLQLVTKNSLSCGRIFVIPALNYEIVLPETGVTTIDIPPQKAGTTLYFTCGMGMFGGQIQF